MTETWNDNDLYDTYHKAVEKAARTAKYKWPWVEVQDAEQELWVHLTKRAERLVELGPGGVQHALGQLMYEYAQQLRRADVLRVFYDLGELEELLERFYVVGAQAAAVDSSSPYERPDFFPTIKDRSGSPNLGRHSSPSGGDAALDSAMDEDFPLPAEVLRRGGFEPGLFGNHEAAMGDVGRALKRMSDIDKAALLARYGLGLTDEEAGRCAALPASLNAQKQRRRRALQKMLDAMNGTSRKGDGVE